MRTWFSSGVATLLHGVLGLKARRGLKAAHAVTPHWLSLMVQLAYWLPGYLWASSGTDSESVCCLHSAWYETGAQYKVWGELLFLGRAELNQMTIAKAQDWLPGLLVLERGVCNRGERCGESDSSPFQFLVLRKGAISLEKIKDTLCGWEWSVAGDLVRLKLEISLKEWFLRISTIASNWCPSVVVLPSGLS